MSRWGLRALPSYPGRVDGPRIASTTFTTREEAEDIRRAMPNGAHMEVVETRAPQQEPPRWGVMFNDGSVRSCWNGRTQRQRATEAAAELAKGYEPDRITLAHRDGPDSPWVRVTPTVGGSNA